MSLPRWYSALTRFPGVSVATDGAARLSIADRAGVRSIAPGERGIDVTSYDVGAQDTIPDVPEAVALAWFVTGDFGYLVDAGVL